MGLFIQPSRRSRPPQPGRGEGDAGPGHRPFFPFWFFLCAEKTLSTGPFLSLGGIFHLKSSFPSCRRFRKLSNGGRPSHGGFFRFQGFLVFLGEVGPKVQGWEKNRPCIRDGRNALDRGY